MTVRPRQVTGIASLARPGANGSEAGPDRSPSFSWEDWFRHAGPHQRAAALGLAQQQGLLYPHQLPAATNGVKPVAAAKESETSAFVASLLGGKAEAPPRFSLETLSFIDNHLDDLQKQAVLRAISTPDLFLLQGLPGTGKSRVLTEVILQAASRGWRVLFLAGQTVSLDVVLERLAGRSEVLALRFLEPTEKPEALPAWLRGFTLEEQKHAFQERTLTGARGNHAQIDATCRQRSGLEPLWAELHAAVERCGDLQQQLRNLQAVLPHSEAAVEREAQTSNPESPVSTQLADLRKAFETDHRELETSLNTQQAALAVCDQESAELAGRIAALEPGYQAKKHNRFWTPAFWANLLNAQIIPAMESLQDQQTKIQARRQTLAQEIDQLRDRQRQRSEQFNQEQAARIASEVQARRQGLVAAQQALEERQRHLDEQWTGLCQRLDEGPIEKTPQAVAAAHQAWLAKKQQVEEECQFAQQWTAFVEQTGPQLAARLPSFANLLAGTASRWHADAKFRDAVATPVDLLIVEDADTLTDTDLLKLTGHAQRCLLVSQTLAEAAPTPTVAEKTLRLPVVPLGAVGCWNRLWQALGGDAGYWPYTWQRDQGRLVCQLMPLTAEDRQHLESEGLADACDIELRILHRPRTRPCLAQVIFPPHGTFEQAFTFMVREVQEFPLEPLGRTGWWSEDAQTWCWHLGPSAPRIHAWLELEPGFRLGTVADEHCSDATRVARIEFDKTAGWDRSKAETWLHRHRHAQDHGRTAFLQTPYRFERPLAKIAQALVRPGEWLTAGLPEPLGGAPAFEFVAVPPRTKHEWPREGAGLELDLSASRHADRLPTGLRQGLPARGFVNYLEAQALFRRLETWMQKEASPSSRVAVLALYEGQAILLRRLVEQSEMLRSRSFGLEIALPSRMHQRECDLIFLSLTRSHPHRSVAFGEDARELPLALTRARSRLIVFGDPGTLCKRCHWHGPLDHLDAHAAHQEHLRLSRLLAYLQNQVHGPVNGAGNGK